MYWIVAIAVIVIIGFILDREIYFYEGVHLGPRFQAWFYDQWAARYDAGKRESQLHDDAMLAQPLLQKLQHVPEPFVLDFATGTGRLSNALLNRPEFRGRIIAVDISQKMLEQAVAKIGSNRNRVGFVRQQSMPLPFPDAAFDVVCCLEVLELLPDATLALREMARLLRPGGVLLTSRGTEESGRKAKVRSAAEFASMLAANGFGNIQVAMWWRLFDRVFASKDGIAEPVGASGLIHVLKCAACSQIHWVAGQHTWQCSQCGREVQVTKEGIVLNGAQPS